MKSLLTTYFAPPRSTQANISPLARKVERWPFGKLALALRRALLRGWVALRDLTLLAISAQRRSAAAALDDLFNSQLGATGVIVCNGPSLNRTELGLLEGIPKITMNRGYLLGDRLPKPVPIATCVSASLVIEQYADDLNGLDSTLVIPWSERTNLRKTNVVQLGQGYQWRFARRLRSSYYPGYTVTNLALQLAFHLGWSRILIVGLDHSYNQTGDPRKEVTTEGSDANHFDPNYFEDGSKWLLPELSLNENSYRIARAAIESDGREVIDCTVDGRCPVFEKKPLREALTQSRSEPRTAE